MHDTNNYTNNFLWISLETQSHHLHGFSLRTQSHQQLHMSSSLDSLVEPNFMDNYIYNLFGFSLVSQSRWQNYVGLPMGWNKACRSNNYTIKKSNSLDSLLESTHVTLDYPKVLVGIDSYNIRECYIADIYNNW